MTETLNTDKLTLKITSWFIHDRVHMKFTVIDTSLGDKYPANFFCILPKFFTSKCKLVEHIGIEKAKELTKKLLEEALIIETNSEVKKEIEYRLKLLQPKPQIIKTCPACKKQFAKRYDFQVFCSFECRKKRARATL